MNGKAQSTVSDKSLVGNYKSFDLTPVKRNPGKIFE
jgi:hypothetical protein